MHPFNVSFKDALSIESDSSAILLNHSFMELYIRIKPEIYHMHFTLSEEDARVNKKKKKKRAKASQDGKISDKES